MNNTSKMWRRINFVIDLLVVSLIWFLLLNLIRLIFNSEQEMKYVISDLLISVEPLFFITYFFYYLISETIYSRTIGKVFTNTVVVDYKMGKPKFHKILIRTLVRFIPIDLFTFFKSNPHGWHDSLSKTIVINIKES